MAKSAAALLSLFLTLNLLFFTVVSSTIEPYPPPPPKGHKHPSPPFPSSSQVESLKDALLELRVCSNLLKDLLHFVAGSPATAPCCSLVNGLVGLEAAVCLCTVVKTNIIGFKFNVPVSFNLLVNNCGMSVPIGYQCQ